MARGAKLREAPPIGAHFQVLVRVYAVGVNPVETYIRAGKMREMTEGSKDELCDLLGIYSVPPQLPYTPGSDAAGVVQAVGAGVTKFKVSACEV